MADGLKKIALTGGIASGKSLAAEFLQTRGIPVIDADAVVHDLLRTDPALQARIRRTFGDTVFDHQGQVDRKALGGRVFQDAGLRRQLESWIHPQVRERIEAFFEAHRDRSMAVALIPLLFESDLARHYDEIWLIDTPPELQIERLRRYRAMGEADARARIDNQMPMAEKRCRAQALPNAHIITNTGEPRDMFAQIERLLG